MRSILLRINRISSVIIHDSEYLPNEEAVMPHAMAAVIENMKKATWALVPVRHQSSSNSMFFRLFPDFFIPYAIEIKADMINVIDKIDIISCIIYNSSAFSSLYKMITLFFVFCKGGVPLQIFSPDGFQCRMVYVFHKFTVVK